MSVLILTMKSYCVMIALLLLSACQSPVLTFPGKQLQGLQANASDFAFAHRYRLLKLEVNPDAPYSVFLRCTVLEGELYVDAARSRQWAKYLQSDQRVRVMLGDFIYDAVAEPVTDPIITNQFLKGRTIYRLRPAAKNAAPPGQPSR